MEISWTHLLTFLLLFLGSHGCSRLSWHQWNSGECVHRSILKFYFIEVDLIYKIVFTSAIQQSDLVIHVYIFFFHVLFHDGLSQNIKYSFLGLYLVVYPFHRGNFSTTYSSCLIAQVLLS